MTTPLPLRLIAGLCAALLSGALAAREVTDQLGRKVEVPDRVASVYGSAPPLTVLTYALEPGLLAGVNFPFTEADKRWLPARVAGLPVMGGLVGMGRTLDVETLMNVRPDLGLAWNTKFNDRAKTEEVFARAGVPLLFITLDSLADWPAALELVGRATGREARGKALAAEVRAGLDRVSKALAGLPPSALPRVYYAESADGLATECDQSFHVEPIALAGGYNVHRCAPSSHMGMERVSLEQVLAWDPEFIVTQEAAFYSAVKTDPRWAGIRAVREGKVYWVPHSPFNWGDRPPSVMRVLGVQWLASLFHPQRVRLDIRAETKRFYRTVLGIELSDADVSAVLEPPGAAGTDGHMHAH
ncbi:ABC transporter substrate-binding protein [Derxia gummosa]|uniref:ABC transporter substrate-binding protein n=1 Tax=Derxia gummosa DSM 723 TaxID=1121388 RepID=A0A8B6XAN3_9BURK|nr:ABC transporter substrate-binding protein [Derxia gummosa]